MHGHKRTISDSIMVLKKCQGVSIAHRQAVSEQFKIAHFVSQVEDRSQLTLHVFRALPGIKKEATGTKGLSQPCNLSMGRFSGILKLTLLTKFLDFFS